MNKKEPLVSVIMPAYNAEKYIESAIDSILNQTYSNFELIIIEDGSTDKTPLIIQSYDDSRIRLFINPMNRGIAYSSNRGIEVSKGKYIALMDDDDIAIRERLEYQVEYLECHNDIDILGGRSEKIDQYGTHISYRNTPRYNPKYNKAVLLFGFVDFCNGTTMIRKEFITKYGLRYNENCYGMQDLKFYMDSSKFGNISSIDKLVLRYRVHDENETKRRCELFREERAKAYADFQRESLVRSGFQLDEKSMTFLNRVLAEIGGHCNSKKELEELYAIFNRILQQAKNMKIDYFDELEQVCKVKLAKQLMNLDIWEL